MARAKPRIEKVCKACERPFRARNQLQIYCGREKCKKDRRLSYMRDYMPKWKARYPSYWKTDKQREYLRKWRAAHPDYFKRWRSRQKRKKKN